MSSPSSTLAKLAAAISLIFAVGAAPAVAGTAVLTEGAGNIFGVSTDPFTYTDTGGGTVNVVTASEIGGFTNDEIRIVDTSGAVAGGGCTQVNLTTVECDSGTGDSIGAATFSVGGGNDSVTIASSEWGTIILNGGSENDILRGGNDQAETINGNDGSDDLFGADGGDLLYGGDSGGGADTGNDRMRGGPGADRFSCNAAGTAAVADGGIDRVRYDDDRATPLNGVTQSINNSPTGDTETDSICTSVESITGTPGNDILTGSSGNNTFAGLAGADTLNGDAGQDFFSGGLGSDIFNGGANGDFVTYTRLGASSPSTPASAGYSTDNGISVTLDNAANDGVKTAANIPGSTVGAATENDNVQSSVETVYGSDGPDRIDAAGIAGPVEFYGNFGADFLIGTAAVDTLIGGLGADNLACGAGTDNFDADPSDTTTGCP